MWEDKKKPCAYKEEEETRIFPPHIRELKVQEKVRVQWCDERCDAWNFLKQGTELQIIARPGQKK